MKKTWINILHNNVNVNIDDSNYILECDDKWNKIYQNSKYSEIISENPTLHYFIFTYFNENKTRLSVWEETIRNPFMCEKLKLTLWNLFTNTQKKYFILSKFVSLCKAKICKVKVNCDLNLIPIDPNSNNSIFIIQDNSKYYFTINDLINICNSALTYSSNLYTESYCPKNPYTNKVFHIGILLKIYFAIRYSKYNIPILFEFFYRSLFDIQKFIKSYEYYIREEIIQTFIRNATEQDNYNYIKDMLASKPFKYKIKISKNFPKDVLVKALKPYLHLYLISNYSLRGDSTRWEAYVTLRKSLLYFFEVNKKFGRKIIRLEKSVCKETGKRTMFKKISFETEYNPVDMLYFHQHREILHFEYSNFYEEDQMEEDESEEDSDDVSIGSYS